MHLGEELLVERLRGERGRDKEGGEQRSGRRGKDDGCQERAGKGWIWGRT
jgi:hypothetical protein